MYKRQALFVLSLFDDRERGYEVMHTQLSHLFTQNLTLSLVYDLSLIHICCRHPVVFKAYGRAGYMQTEKHFAYLIQRCKDGFVAVSYTHLDVYKRQGVHGNACIGKIPNLYCSVPSTAQQFAKGIGINSQALLRRDVYKRQ